MAADTTNETLDVRSGTVADIGPAITWNVEYEGNGFYSLHPNGQKNVYLDVYGEFTTVQSEDTMWQRSFASCGGVTWTCDGLVLCVDDYGNVDTDYPEFLDVEQMAWRMVQTDEYVEFSSFVSTDMFLGTNSSKSITSLVSAGTLWAEGSDFTLEHSVPRITTTSSGYIQSNSYTIAGEIKVTHIPTGIEHNINVYVGTSSPDKVAIDFAENYFAASHYVKIEFGATIFRVDGQYYPSVAKGFMPHCSEPLSIPIPEQAIEYSWVHTHPQGSVSEFSGQDMDFADDNNMVIYVASIEREVYIYMPETRGISYVSDFWPTSLTESQKATLVEKYRAIWEGHFKGGACTQLWEGCTQFPWPNDE